MDAEDIFNEDNPKKKTFKDQLEDRPIKKEHPIETEFKKLKESEPEPTGGFVTGIIEEPHERIPVKKTIDNIQERIQKDREKIQHQASDEDKSEPKQAKPKKLLKKIVPSGIIIAVAILVLTMYPFGELSRNNNKIGAMQYLAQLSGQDPLQFRKELRDQVLNEYKQMLEMDEPSRKAFELQEENEFLKQNKESETKQRESQQSQWELNQKVEKYERVELQNLFEDLTRRLVFEQRLTSFELARMIEDEVRPSFAARNVHACGIALREAVRGEVVRVLVHRVLHQPVDVAIPKAVHRAPP